MKNKIPLKFYTEQSSYVVGEGYTTAWLPLKTTVDITGTPKKSAYFGETGNPHMVSRSMMLKRWESRRRLQ